MPQDIRVVDIGLAVWVVLWLIAGVLVFDSIRQLEDGGRAVVSAGQGLDETSDALDRAAAGLHETGNAMKALGSLPFLTGDPGAAVSQTADDVERLADRVRVTAEDARTTGADAQDSASTLAWILGLAVALGTTLPLVLMYLLLRPLIAKELKARG